MGGLGPGIGGLEYVVIGLVALLVLGPERLPVMLHKLGKMVAKARGMANEFRASFDEMARQSELDELRKEVAALRTGQLGQGAVPLGAEADAAFRDIRSELERPLDAPTLPAPAAMDAEPAMTPLTSEWPDETAIDAPPPKPRPVRKATPKAAGAKAAAKPRTATPRKTKSAPLVEGGATKPVRVRKSKAEL